MLFAVVLYRALNNHRPCCAAGGVDNERITPMAVLLMPTVLLKSACKTVGRVEAAGGVAIERLITLGRVVAAGCVAKERINNRWPCCRCRGVVKER